jgi:hypothetical protein
MANSDADALLAQAMPPYALIIAAWRRSSGA